MLNEEFVWGGGGVREAGRKIYIEKNIERCVENSVRFKFKYIENKQTNEVVPHIKVPHEPVRLKGTGNKKKLPLVLQHCWK